MKILLLFAVLPFAAVAVAQEPSPLDPKARTAGVTFRSAFEEYRKFVEQEPADWRKANDEVRRAAEKPPAKPSAAGHGGHHK